MSQIEGAPTVEILLRVKPLLLYLISSKMEIFLKRYEKPEKHLVPPFSVFKSAMIVSVKCVVSAQ
ncbi:hypothetical protein [Desulfopila sp. IMCC35008]|uniref:hypothetical protein n=1 Tax=Desulfopila sp. IMCC35008 TaxID=2653858 RepID=UPI0013D4BB07|nr:hypothetical protein [Desulfopila sp. IMCC35008]